ncbi:hypothetical protein ASAP_2527 [Asaia bogorensis]|uniref:Uncharacterized protein n=1 Tax=Asaia bogorensis TaxID=91915 RepID=A0A060QLR9_9PROT|nr:hypothetical protein ASAP_2527 [Asaia bogorensis]
MPRPGNDRGRYRLDSMGAARRMAQALSARIHEACRFSIPEKSDRAER